MISLIIGITSRCQLSCRMCANKSFPDISLEDFKDIIDWAKADEVIPDGNGEPLLHPDIVEMVDYIPCKSAIVTNGECLDRGMVDDLVDAGLSELRISIDGPDIVSHETLRPDGNWSHVICNTAYAVKQLPVTVFSVLTMENSESLLIMPKLLYELGIKKWVVWDCQDYGNELKQGLKGLSTDYSMRLRLMAEGVVELALHDGGEKHGCKAPQTQMYVHSNGDLSICCIADDVVFGNFREMSWEEARTKALSIDLSTMPGRHQNCRDWIGR